MKIFIAALLLIACSGCINIALHSEGVYPPYCATKKVACSIAEAFSEKPEWHYGSVGEAKIARSYALLFLPVAIVSLPIEAIADTFTLPYDVWATYE